MRPNIPCVNPEAGWSSRCARTLRTTWRIPRSSPWSSATPSSLASPSVSGPPRPPTSRLRMTRPPSPPRSALVVVLVFMCSCVCGLGCSRAWSSLSFEWASVLVLRLCVRVFGLCVRVCVCMVCLGVSLGVKRVVCKLCARHVSQVHMASVCCISLQGTCTRHMRKSVCRHMHKTHAQERL